MRPRRAGGCTDRPTTGGGPVDGGQAPRTRLQPVRCPQPRRSRSAVRTCAELTGGHSRRRMTARNIPSVPCRCGQSCTVGPVAEIGHAGQQRAGVDQLAACRAAGRSRRRSRPDAASRSRRRRSRPAGPAWPRMPAAPAAAGPGRRRRTAGAASGPPVGGAAPPGRCTARPAITRSKEPAGRPGSRPSAVCTVTGRSRHRPPDQVGPVRGDLDRVQPGAALRGQRAQQAGLAARPGGQIQPAEVRARQRSVRQRGGHQLGSLVLDGCPAVGDRPDRARIAAVQVDAERRVQRGQRRRTPPPARPGRSGRAGRPGARRAARRRPAAPVRARRWRRPRSSASPNGADDPPGVGQRHGQVTERILGGVGRQPLDPGVQVGLGDPAQHRVDVAGATWLVARPHQVDGRRDRRVRRDPGAQDLVGAQPQGVDHHAVQLGDRPITAGRDHRVQLTERPAAAVGQLGGQRGVPAGQPALVEDARAGSGSRRRRGTRTAAEQIEAACRAGSRLRAACGSADGAGGPLAPSPPAAVGGRPRWRPASSAGGSSSPAPSPEPGGPPRAQSAAGIGRRPGGVTAPSAHRSRCRCRPAPRAWSSPAHLAGDAVPATVRSSPSVTTRPGRERSRPQGESVQAPGSGVTDRISRSMAMAGARPVDPGVGRGDLARVGRPRRRVAGGPARCRLQPVEGGQRAVAHR